MIMDIKSFVSEMNTKNWNETGTPLLISVLGSEIKRHPEYHAELGGKKLKQWIMENIAVINAKVIQHPQQKEKAGIIPENEKYEYMVVNAPVKIEHHSKNQLLELMSIINKLPQEDIDNIYIPTSALCKLAALK